MLAVHSKIAHQLYRVVAEHKILVHEYRNHKCVKRHGQYWPLPEHVRFFRRYLLYDNPHVSKFDIFPNEFRAAMNRLLKAEYPDTDELYFHARIPLEQIRKEMEHLTTSRALTREDKVALARHNLRRLRIMEECFQWIAATPSMWRHYNRFFNITQC